MKDPKRLPYPVLSIGNITVGGTGKTPAAIALAEEAKKRGLNPVILTRGYKGRSPGPVFVAPPAYPLQDFCGNPYRLVHTVEDAGDEPVLIAGRLRNVPVVKCADRFEGGSFAIRELPAHKHESLVFILDDGFQHWKLHRDINIVLVDGLDPFGNRKMLPLGPLREPVGELKRADLLVITKARNEALRDELKELAPGAPVFFAGHKLSGIRNVHGTLLPLDVFRKKRVFAFCGVANPESFRQTVLSLTDKLAGLKKYGDHYRYTRKEIVSLERQREQSGAELLVTTEKDMVKLRELKAPDTIVCLEIGFNAEKAFFDSIFERLTNNATAV